MVTCFGDCEIPVELERRLATFDEALSEVEDILQNFEKVPYSDVCAQVIDVVLAWSWCKSTYTVFQFILHITIPEMHHNNVSE